MTTKTPVWQQGGKITIRKTIGVALLAFGWIVIACCLSQPAQAETYAIILAGDAERVIPGYSARDVFENSLTAISRALKVDWGVPPRNILEVFAWKITGWEFETKVQELLKELTLENTLMFFYIGHGNAVEVEPDFVRSNAAERQRLGDYSLVYSDLDRLLGENAGNSFIVLDSCKSGAAVTKMSSDRWLLTATDATKDTPSLDPVGAFQDIYGNEVTSFTAALVEAMAKASTAKSLYAKIMDPDTAALRAARIGNPQLSPASGQSDIILDGSLPSQNEDLAGTTLKLSVSARVIGELPRSHRGKHVGTTMTSYTIVVNGGKTLWPGELMTIAETSSGTYAIEIHATGRIVGSGDCELRAKAQGYPRITFKQHQYPFATATNFSLPFSGTLTCQGETYSLAEGIIQCEYARTGTTNHVDYWMDIAFTGSAILQRAAK